MRWTALALVGVLAAGVACDRGSSAPGQQARRAPAAAAPAEAAEAAPETPQAEAREYAYDATGKRDPFRSFVLERKRELAEAERGPLEQFDLNQLEVVAVVWDTKRRRALITDPSGRGYVIQEGTAVGKNDGRVVRIDDNLVLVRETYVDYLGDQTLKDVEMQVRQSQGG